MSNSGKKTGKKKRSKSPSKRRIDAGQDVAEEGSDYVPSATEQLRMNTTPGTRKGVELKEPRSREVLVQILKAGEKNADANFEMGLVEHREKNYEKAIEYLKKAAVLLGDRADHRLLLTLGLSQLQKYKAGEDAVDQEALRNAHRSLTRSLKYQENKHSRDFRMALGYVYEAYGEMNEALDEYSNAVTDHPEHEKNGIVSLKIADISFHPDFQGEQQSSGISYLEYSAVTAPPPEFTEAQLTFLCARAYQIVGRAEEGTNWMYYVFQTFVFPTAKDSGPYKGKDVESAFLVWGQDADKWLERARLYVRHDLNVFAVDAYSQALQLSETHSVDQWVEIARACYKIRRVEPALQAAASALEIDRCNQTVRALLRRWSEDWEKMLNYEEHLIVKIQSAHRGVTGRRKGRVRMKALRVRRKQRTGACTTIALWYRYQRGRASRKLQRAQKKEKERKVRFFMTRITNKVIAMSYGKWKHVYETNKGVRLMIARRCGKMEAKCFGKWHGWVDERLVEKRAIEAHRREQDELVHKNLKKMFNRVLHQSWSSWHNFAKGSIRIKKKVKNAMLNRKRDLFTLWYANVWDAIEEVQIANEPTVVIRSTMDDGKRRRRQQKMLSKERQNGAPSSPSSPSSPQASLSPPGKIVDGPRSPYVVGSGNAWKRNHARGTAIMSALYRARSSGCAMVPGGIPIAEPEMVKMFTCKSVVSQVAPFTRADARYAIAPILRTNTTIRSLLLYNSDIRDKGVMAIAQALAESEVSVLQTLGLGNNKIGVRGAQALAATLKRKHVTLTALYLEDNPGVGDEGLHAISESLLENVRLEKLVLAKSRITDKGIQDLVATLRINDTVNSLSLQHNCISSKGARALGSVIGTDNKVLRKLNLCGNVDIGEKGGIALAKAATRSDGVLEDLNLSRCNIGDHTAEAIADALDHERVETNSIRLQNLQLADNNIGGKDAKRLALTLNLKCPDCVLDVAGNHIDTEIEGFIAFLHFEKRIGSPRRSPRMKKNHVTKSSPIFKRSDPSPFSPDGFTFSAQQAQRVAHGLQTSAGKSGDEEIDEKEEEDGGIALMSL